MELERRYPSHVVSLNRAVAVAMSEGFEKGLMIIDQLGCTTELETYYLYHSARADILRRMGRRDEALQEYQRALALTNNAVEQQYLRRRIAEITPLIEWRRVSIARFASLSASLLFSRRTCSIEKCGT